MVIMIIFLVLTVLFIIGTVIYLNNKKKNVNTTIATRNAILASDSLYNQ